MKQRIKQSIIAICILLIIVGIALWATEKERISKKFAQNLFDYPLPTQTKVIAQDYFYGYSFNHLTGSGGSMPVIASIKLSTILSKEEILHFYKEAEFFPFPKSDKKGVELELYFEDEYQLKESEDGYYYSGKTDGTKRISHYFDKVGNIKSMTKEEKNELYYVLQVSSSFDYFLNIH